MPMGILCPLKSWQPQMYQAGCHLNFLVQGLIFLSPVWQLALNPATEILQCLPELHLFSQKQGVLWKIGEKY